MPWQQRNVTKKADNSLRQTSITETSEHAWVVILFRPVQIFTSLSLVAGWASEMLFRLNWRPYQTRFTASSSILRTRMWHFDTNSSPCYCYFQRDNWTEYLRFGWQDKSVPFLWGRLLQWNISGKWYYFSELMLDLVICFNNSASTRLCFGCEQRLSTFLMF